MHCVTSVAIITARGGSKRIPRKNIRPFRGKPIISWPIQAALDTKLFDEVMVSTDDDEIAQLAISFGATVPFMRSADTANDTATTADVLYEVLNVYEQVGRTFDNACCLYPTAVFATAEILREAHELLTSTGYEVIIPVTPFEYPIWRSLRRDDTGRVELNWPENLNARSQDLPAAFHDVGQFYWFRTEAFRRSRTLMGTSTGSMIVPPSEVHDIDTEEDWALAEIKHEWRERSAR